MIVGHLDDEEPGHELPAERAYRRGDQHGRPLAANVAHREVARARVAHYDLVVEPAVLKQVANRAGGRVVFPSRDAVCLAEHHDSVPQVLVIINQHPRRAGVDDVICLGRQKPGHRLPGRRLAGRRRSEQ